MTQFSFPALVVRNVNDTPREIIPDTNFQVTAPRNSTFRYRLDDEQPDDDGFRAVTVNGTRFGISSNNERIPEANVDAFLGTIRWEGNRTTILELELRISPNTVISYIVVIGGDPLPPITTVAQFNNFVENRIDSFEQATGPFAPGAPIRWDSIPGVTTSNNEIFSGTNGADTLSGGNGNDSMFGEGGNDQLMGGTGNDRLEGGGGRDTLFGGDNMDVLRGNGGNDNLVGGLGSDTLRGNAGNDRLNGGGGRDNLQGDGGNDTINGGNGNDLIRGNAGADRLSGEIGRDTLDGGGANDVLFGGGGGDRLLGGTGSDTLFGGSGNDRMFGGGGRDILRGGTGDDTLNGGVANDVLTGNAGSDVFIFEDGSGQDRIRDFASGEDRIDLTDLSAISDFDDLLNNHTQQDANDVLITDGNGVSITVEDTLIGELEAEDFIF